MTRKSVGAAGEDDAARFLAARGYRIVARNVRPLRGMARGEIDIIAWDGPMLCIVEVKTRRGSAAAAAENVTPAKQRQLVTLAEAWLAGREAAGESEVCEAPVRFDVVCVCPPGPRSRRPRLTLIRDAFRPA